MSCIYCSSQPHDPSPCSCSHAPCIHDRNRDIERFKAQTKKLQTELCEMRSSILDARTPGSHDFFGPLLRANTLAHIEQLIELCTETLK